MYDMQLFRSLLARECAKRKMLTIAIETGVSTSAVSYHCNGKRKPSNERMKRYAQALRIPEECIILGTDEHLITRHIEEQRGFVALSKTKNHHENSALHPEEFLRPTDRIAGQANDPVPESPRDRERQHV